MEGVMKRGFMKVGSYSLMITGRLMLELFRVMRATYAPA